MSVKSVPAVRYDKGIATESRDALTVEAPLHVRINGTAYSTTMRTPGADRELVRGMLFTENIVFEKTGLLFHETIDPQTGFAGLIDVSIPESEVPDRLEDRRSQLATSSCGMCGVRDPRDIAIAGAPLTIHSGEELHLDSIPGMMSLMEASQRMHRETGGCHAAAAFRYDGTLLAAFEDVGRHNAVDKVVGRLLATNTLNDAACLTVSGRISYEIVFKACRARLPYIIAVSAPTSLAVETAELMGITLIGFCRGTRATVYSHPNRVVADAAIHATVL